MKWHYYLKVGLKSSKLAKEEVEQARKNGVIAKSVGRFLYVGKLTIDK